MIDYEQRRVQRAFALAIQEECPEVVSNTDTIVVSPWIPCPATHVLHIGKRKMIVELCHPVCIARNDQHNHQCRYTAGDGGVFVGLYCPVDIFGNPNAVYVGYLLPGAQKIAAQWMFQTRDVYAAYRALCEPQSEQVDSIVNRDINFFVRN
jgi:hypothetical protein